ncbi:alpha/beta hydrolase [Tsukamurella sp. 1534]|uniref:alpha/beta hydrolase n=1 Tax=Tsukamurella sp. 1534 TaxID=1151061 RepID=UPI0002F33D2B|nr:alpha/beta hydrolase [Tsukamurella sp. 1534]
MPAEFSLPGHAGELVAYRWDVDSPRRIVLLAHGYGEHAGRYPHVAAALQADGAVVYAVDHIGHGRSPGERVLIEDYEGVVSDLHLLYERAVSEHPGLPVALVGHSMGGMIAARYGQRYGRELESLVLSGPVLGPARLVLNLIGLDEIPDVPLDPALLSRDAAVGTAYAADPLVWHGPFKKPTVAAWKRALDTIDAGGTLGTRTLWLHGSDDEIVVPEETRAAWRVIHPEASEEKLYPGARHEIFNETNSAEVLADVVAFLNRA